MLSKIPAYNKKFSELAINILGDGFVDIHVYTFNATALLRPTGLEVCLADKSAFLKFPLNYPHICQS